MISGNKTSSHDLGSVSAWGSKWVKPHVIEEGAEAWNKGWSQEMQLFVSYGNQGQVLWSTSLFKLVLQAAMASWGHVLKGKKCGKTTGKCILWKTMNCPQFKEGLVNTKQNHSQKTRSDVDHGSHSLCHPRRRSQAWCYTPLAVCFPRKVTIQFLT